MISAKSFSYPFAVKTSLFTKYFFLFGNKFEKTLVTCMTMFFGLQPIVGVILGTYVMLAVGVISVVSGTSAVVVNLIVGYTGCYVISGVGVIVSVSISVD